MSVLAIRHEEGNKSWANQYLLDPLNPVEAWQTAQVGGQYSNAIPSQHSHNSKNNPFSPSNPFRDPHTVSKASSASSGFPARSQSQRVPDRASSVSQKENTNPFRPLSSLSNESTPRQQQDTKLSRHRSDASSYDYRLRPRQLAETTDRTSRSQRPLSTSSRSPRSPHTSRSPRYQPMRGVPVDMIDSLDTSFGGAYHHDGPFDATLAARNRTPWKSPVEATRIGNLMALEATAEADIENALEQHRPLDGVAAFPPGTVAGGKRVSYEEYDIQRLDGNYRRWDGISYLDNDLKGKGIEGFIGDKNEKADLQKSKSLDKGHQRGVSEDANSFEMQDRGGEGSSTASDIYKTNGLRRGGSTAGRLENVGAKIKRKFSLSRKSKRSNEVQQ